MKSRIARHPVFTYYFLAYVCSWIVAVPLALQVQGFTTTHLPMWLHYLTAYGPAVAALIVSRLASPGNLSRSRRRTHSATWLLIGVSSPLMLFCVAQLVGLVIEAPTPRWSALGDVNFLPSLGVSAWFLWLITSGFGEETGWRGFALPRLQARHSALASSCLIAVAWAGWHLPAFFYLPSYLAIGLKILPGFFIGILAGSIVLTWLYNNSSGSVLAVVLWHASFNFVTGSPNATGVAAAVTSTLVIAWAVAIVWFYDWATFVMPHARSVRAEASERVRPLPGDELIPAAAGSLTHAITIRSAPHDVWQWLAQMGAGRAGWYSYDRLDNGGHRSAYYIDPGLQRVAVGMLMPGLPGAREGFVVVRFERDRFLTLGWPRREGGYGSTWTFFLEEREPGVTRLIVRARGPKGYRLFGLPSWISVVAVRLVHFIMERRQLLGIVRRAEVHA